MAAIKTLQYRISIHVCGVSFFVKLFRITARGSRPGECFFCNQGTLIDYVFPSIKLSLGNHTVGSMYIQTISKLKPTMWFGSTFSFWFFHVQRFYLIIQNHSRAVNPQTKNPENIFHEKSSDWQVAKSCIQVIGWSVYCVSHYLLIALLFRRFLCISLRCIRKECSLKSLFSQAPNSDSHVNFPSYRLQEIWDLYINEISKLHTFWPPISFTYTHLSFACAWIWNKNINLLSH